MWVNEAEPIQAREKFTKCWNFLLGKFTNDNETSCFQYSEKTEEDFQLKTCDNKFLINTNLRNTGKYIMNMKTDVPSCRKFF